jgi:6-phosphogluconolactonase (cycloisomerase 2 family)
MFTVRSKILVAALAISTTLTLMASGSAHGRPASDDARRGEPSATVYIGSNNPEAGQNSILAYRQEADGSLTPLAGSPFLTGGTGTANAEQKLGPDDVDKGVIVNGDHTLLFAVNSGSNTIAVFRIGADGALTPVAGSPFASGGTQPVSLALSGKFLFVANKNQDPEQGQSDAAPNITAFKVKKNGKLKAVHMSTVERAAGSSPAQVLTSPSGDLLFSVDFGVDVFNPDPFNHLASAVHAAEIRKNGRLEEATVTPAAVPANPPIALGLLAHPTESILYVGFPAAGQVGIYTYDAAGNLTFVRSAADSGALVCWFAVDAGAHYLYASNNGDNSVSVFDISDPTTPVEIQRLELAVNLETPSAPVELALDPSGHFLYVVGQRHSLDASETGGNVVHVLEVAADGTVAEASFSPIALPIPVAAHPHGIVVF